MVKTKWKYSKETEIQRLAQIASQIGNRFYDKNGFLVLPFPVKNDPKTIFLPPLRYPKNLFKKAAKLKLSIPMKIPDGLLKTLNNLLSVRVRPSQSAYISQGSDPFKKQKSAWQKVEKRFWKMLFDFIPESKNIKSLEIWPTQLGSICSFWHTKGKIYIWLRLDADVSHIAEGVISTLIKIEPYTPARFNLIDYSWNEKEAIVDFLLTQTPLTNLFPNYQPTLYALKLENKFFKEESNKYLQSLGVKIGEIFKIKKREIYCNNKLLPANLFSKKETKLLKLFIKNKNSVIDFDQIAHVLWKKNTEEKFSLWAISKTIERLRKKLEKLNISAESLQTKHGKGYLLVD